MTSPEQMSSTARRTAEISHVEIDGHRLRLGVWPGSAAQPPLLLFNGIGGNLELLSPFADALQDVTVVSFDIPGIGGSGIRYLPYRLSHMADLAASVATHTGHGTIDVLGVSWGGALAQVFAFRHRSRCRRLVLCATAAGAPAMVPGAPWVLAKLLSPRRYYERDYMTRNAGKI